MEDVDTNADKWELIVGMAFVGNICSNTSFFWSNCCGSEMCMHMLDFLMKKKIVYTIILTTTAVTTFITTTTTVVTLLLVLLSLPFTSIVVTTFIASIAVTTFITSIAVTTFITTTAVGLCLQHLCMQIFLFFNRLFFQFSSRIMSNE